MKNESGVTAKEAHDFVSFPKTYEALRQTIISIQMGRRRSEGRDRRVRCDEGVSTDEMGEEKTKPQT